MRSIRLSLLVYFLLLSTVALAAVSWLVYQTTAHSLERRRLDSRRLVESQYQADVAKARAALDRRLLRQAQALASMARSSWLHPEGLYPLGMIGAAALPQSHNQFGLWLAEGAYPPLMMRLAHHRLVIYIESADDVIPFVEAGQPQEYFQTYSALGRELQRSESLGEARLRLDPTFRTQAELLQERFDDVDVRPGVKARRVTLKSSVPRFRPSGHPGPWTWRSVKGGMFRPGGPPPGGRPGGNSGRFGGPGPKRPTTGKPPSPPPPPRRNNGNRVIESPVLFVQYAADLAPLDAEIANIAQERDEGLAQINAETRADLSDLRTRLLWVSLATLVALWAGGFLLVRLGLAPLARMTDAVSRVTPLDFALHLDPAGLPRELRPIAARLAQTLEELHRAFEREKQAAADISHELRTPLASLLTTVEVALRKARTVEEYQEILEECRFSGEQMSLLVERLLTLARLDAGADRCRPRPADLAELAVQCADLVRPLARAKGLALHVDVIEGLPALTDPDKVREVLTNLLHNAVEYNRPDGTIDLSVRREGNRAVLEVADTGIGIAAEQRERIFERFYRADPSRHADTPHAGLGLAIVKSYVELMGGRIAVVSGAGGTTFRVELPCEPVNDAAGAIAATVPEPISTSIQER